MVLADYNILEKIFEGTGTVVYKASPKEDPDRRVALKVLKGGSVSEYKRAQFGQKIEHLKVLSDPSLITPSLVRESDDSILLVQDYFDGISIDNLINGKAVSLKVFFTIACNLVRLLDKVHEVGIIHGGIKPHNILVNPNTLEILIENINPKDVNQTKPITENFFSGGLISHGTGSEKEFRTIIVNQSINNNKMVLLISSAFNNPINVGDYLEFSVGCDGQYTTCKDKFSNLSNFGGFPFMPLSNPSMLKVSQNVSSGGKK